LSYVPLILLFEEDRSE